MKPSIFFLAGVHGVGKGTLASKLARSTGLNCYSASGLIKERKRAPVDKAKTVIDPDENQTYLLDAVQELGSTHCHFILDGHFTLWGEDGVYDVPLSIFESLPIAGIIVLSESAATVAERLDSRDGNCIDTATLEAHLDAELDRARYVSRQLDIPMLEISSEQSGLAHQWIGAMTESCCFSLASSTV